MSTIILRVPRNHYSRTWSICRISYSSVPIVSTTNHGVLGQIHACRKFHINATLKALVNPQTPKVKPVKELQELREKLPEDYIGQGIRDFKPITPKELKQLQEEAEANEKLFQQEEASSRKPPPESVAIVGYYYLDST